MTNEKYAIRFGLGAIKAVGLGMMEAVVAERQTHGEFGDVYDFARRINPRMVNKKSIEALAKAGAFDSIHTNRQQIAESFEILSAYSIRQNEEASSDQMTLFAGTKEADVKPQLKQSGDFNGRERLKSEFEAFGFFLSSHPLDEVASDLRKRGVIFSDKIERDELRDGMLVKMAGVVATSKHRSSVRGRFAYVTFSDMFGISEAMIFDEALITSARDILVDGSSVVFECLIRKDQGGARILIQSLKKTEDFIKNTEAAKQEFEDIKQQFVRSQRPRNAEPKKVAQPAPVALQQPRQIPAQLEIKITKRDQILMLKSLLQQLVAADQQQNTTEIFLLADGKKVQLTQKFLLTEIDLLRINHILG
ncbi:MAG: hypothetical protein FJX34_00550 [Alphaproteobacteria bacterium]|nr:hypothetical protein [Alphaproteobacteria bacterium]